MGAKEAGSITVLGCDHLRDEVAMKRQVGYVSPDLNFQPWGKIGKAIQFTRSFRPSWDDEYCDRLLESMHLHPDERILALSFGARIKLALILTLAWRPKLLVLDEPTVGLDAISKQQIFSETACRCQPRRSHGVHLVAWPDRSRALHGPRRHDQGRVRIPVHREHSFRFNVNTDSGHREHRFWSR